MPDSFNFFDTLPDELCLLVENNLDDSDKSRFDSTCSRFYNLGFNNPPGQMFGLFHEFKQPHLYEASRQVQKLLLHVVRGELRQAENMIQQDPGLLLETGVVIDYSNRTVEGTALRLALAAEDVGRYTECAYIWGPPLDFDFNRLTDEFLKNLSPVENTAYVLCADTLFYIDKINDEVLGIVLTENAIREFYAVVKNCGNGSVLSLEQLQKIKHITGHDCSEGMTEMILRHLRKLPYGEEHIAQQIKEQFPNGWERQAQEKANRDVAALIKVEEAIANSLSNKDCAQAIQEFRDYLEFEYKEKGIIKTGKHFNSQILIEAFRIYNLKDCIYYDARQSKLFWSNVIGYIQRFLPASYAQVFCQSNYTTEYNYDKLKRSLEFRYFIGIFYPLDGNPDYRLGFDFAAKLMRGLALNQSHLPFVCFSNMVAQKELVIRELLGPVHSERQNCVII